MAASPNSQQAITKIEAVIETIADCLQRDERIYIPLRCRPTARSADNSDIEPKHIKVCWPSKTAQEARRFTVLLRILELMHEALIAGKVVSKRNIYYQDPELFKTQAVVDRDVDLLAYTFGLRRADLHVTAAAKGLFAGSISLKRFDGTATCIGDDGNVHLVPDSNLTYSARSTQASWILVVEKESTFRTLICKKIHQHASIGEGIILTAKGYPDVSTRSLLRHLSERPNASTLPPLIFMLADYNPHGLAIMSTYKHGSQRLSHESQHLNVSSIQWLGIRSSDIRANILSSDEQDCHGLLQLSLNDRKKAAKMLENNAAFSEHGKEAEWRTELQVMLMLGVKGEMEILERDDADIGRWVEERLASHTAFVGNMVDVGPAETGERLV